MVAKKKILKLTNEIENDYFLIGIASHENDYRLNWAVNKSLNLDLKKNEDLLVSHPKHKIIINYSLYNYNDEINYRTYNLISNKSEKGFLIPVMKNIDFVLKVSGSLDKDIINDLISNLKKVDIIITAFLINELSDKLKRIFLF